MKFIFFTTFKKIRRARRITQFIILVSFLVTFLITRLTTHLQRAGILPVQQHQPYVHHLVPGIFLLLISGYIGLSFWSNARLRKYMSVLFGIGAALTIDEFALWLYLRDVYWARQGRDSVDAVIIVATLLLILFAISEFREQRSLRKVLKDVREDIEKS